jgi:hypothetical protein
LIAPLIAQESWYEKLNRWEEALDAYERKYQNSVGTPAYVDAALGRLRHDTFLLPQDNPVSAKMYDGPLGFTSTAPSLVTFPHS